MSADDVYPRLVTPCPTCKGEPDDHLIEVGQFANGDPLKMWGCTDCTGGWRVVRPGSDWEIERGRYGLGGEVTP